MNETIKCPSSIGKIEKGATNNSNLIIPPKRTDKRVKPENIPGKLKTLNQWVFWRFKKETNSDGSTRLTKPPYQANGLSMASTTKRETWSSFEEINKRYQAGSCDGIGFVLADGDGIAGIDLDHCVFDGVPTDAALEILERFKGKAYIELSPSNEGLHIFAFGSHQRSGKGNGDSKWVEVYDGKSPRYLTVTGVKLTEWSADEPGECPDALEWLHKKYFAEPSKEPETEPKSRQSEPVSDDDELIARIRRMSAQGEKFTSLFDNGIKLDTFTGEIIETSKSELDASLCEILAWACNRDPIQMDRIFRRSALMREKWDSTRGKTTYGELTIKNALEFNARNGSKTLGKYDEQSLNNDEVGIIPEAYMDTANSTFPEPYPGVMAETVEMALKASHKPQKSLLTLAILTAMASAVDGRFHIIGGTRLNIYGLGVAETGEGKDLPGRLAEEFASTAGARLIGKPASGQGLEDSLIDDQGMLTRIDEVGHFLRNLQSQNVASHQRELVENLLKLFSASQGKYLTRVKATSKGTTPPRELTNPCLSFLGFTTPSALSDGLTRESVEQGLLNRFILAMGDTNVRQRNTSHHIQLDIEALKVIQNVDFDFDDGPKGNLEAILGKRITRGSEWRIIRYCDFDGAAEYLDESMNRFQDEASEAPTPEARALLRRSLEKVKRIAGVLAVWDDPKRPRIEIEHLEWAESVVRASNTNLLNFAAHHIHDSHILADAARVADVMAKILRHEIKLHKTPELDIKRHEKNWVSKTATLRNSKLDSKRFSEALRHLVESGEVAEGVLPKGRRSVSYLYFRGDS